MRFDRMPAVAAVLVVGAAYADPTGPIQRIVDPGPPEQLHYVVNPASFLTTTDFEASEGWDLGSSICGAEFDAVCGNPPGSLNGGFANVCVPKNHAASINCCFNDPNEDTGWFMSGSSQHCRSPGISDAHPSSGTQHLRFQYDPNGGSPPGCSGFGSGCRQAAFCTDGVGFPTPDAHVTTFTVDISGSATLGSSLIWGLCEYQPPAVRFNTYIYMYYLGGVYVYDFLAGTGCDPFGCGYWSDFSPGYMTFRITLDPCNDVIIYEAGPQDDPQIFHLEPFGFVPPNSTIRAYMETNAVVYLTDHYGETWDIDNQRMEQGPGCPDACCDGGTGTCTDGVDLADCTGPSLTWYENQECANLVEPGTTNPISCARDTGACCDAGPGAGGPGPEGACSPTLPEDCTGTYDTWTKRADCADVTCIEVTGACCRLLTGECEDGVLMGDCSGPQDRWSVEASCSQTPCELVTGACCDSDAFGACTQTTQAGCSCPKCSWTKLADCADVECTHAAIPTTSQWGLIILALILLVAAKVTFGPRVPRPLR